MSNIKICIVGLGNCASSLIQGIYQSKKQQIKGLLHEKIGPYSCSDIEVVAAFDIDERKVGLDVSKAIFSKPNNTLTFCDVPHIGVSVLRGPTLDGFATHMNDYDADVRFVESKTEPVDVQKVLAKLKPDILINYLPVGSQKATEYYAQCCLDAGVNFINAIPVFICSQGDWFEKFKQKKLVCAGDDIKSQVGATIIHRILTDVFEQRGATLLRTYQLNTGGNTDFLNMKDQSRLASKKISKTEAVQSQLKVPLAQNNIHVGPSDYVPWQKDNKICFIRMEGELFGGAPISLDLKLSVEDSPNSAGVMIDAIRCMKLAIDRGMSGYLEAISQFTFKHPRTQVTDAQAFRQLAEFLK